MGVIRLLLAVSVLLSHSAGARALPLVGGELAVQLFFMISGFYMAMVLTEKYAGPGGVTQTKAFWIGRTLRIYPTYFATAIATLLLFAAIRSSWFAEFLAQGPAMMAFELWLNLVIVGQELTLWLAQGADGLGFTTDFRPWPYPQPRNFMLVPQAWSLSLELVFYALAPWLNRWSTAALALAAVVSCAARFATYAALGLDFDPWTNRFLPFEIAIFIAGMIAYRMYSRYRMPQAMPAAAVLALIVLVIVAFPSLPKPRWMGVQLADFAVLVGFFFALPFAFRATRSSHVDRAIGDLSYPFYLAHLAVIMLLEQLMRPQGALFQATAIAVTLAAAALLLVSVDRPVERLRSRLARAALASDARPAGAPAGVSQATS
jgi:peptidoglycan/LPS O-acetylase OafA/YrhL